MFGIKPHIITALAAGLLFLGCEAQPPTSDPNASGGTRPQPGSAAPLVSTQAVRSFLATGLIRGLPADGKSVVIRHEDIPGLMPKMTMEFTVRDTNELQGLEVGERITFSVRAGEEESWIEGIHQVDPGDVRAVPLPVDPPSSALLHAAQLKPGDVLPEVGLTAENGRTIHLSDYRGRALAFTFLFTRCPLPDYCPRLSRNFSRSRDLLLKQAAGATNWQFLSISFDPEYDRPEVLRRYAEVHRGEVTDRWLFASASTNVMASMAAQLDFRFADQGGSFLHNLRTVVLDPQGRVFRQFDGNRWTAEELVQALGEAARVRP